MESAPASFHPAFVLLALGVLGAAGVGWRFGLRRALQVGSAALFVGLLWLAAYGGRASWPVDFFLFSDPLLALVTGLAGRVLVPLLLVSLVFLALAAVMGRVFCSHLCPLGGLFDLSDRWLARRQKAERNRDGFARARRVKWVILGGVLAAAAAGFNLLGWFDPLVLVTRLSAMIFYPVVLGLQDLALQVVRPVAGWLDWPSLAYLELSLPSFGGAFVFGVMIAGLLLLSRLQPRFWCRHLCPLGALLGLAGHCAPYRRRVSEACNGCNLCVRKCPAGAIHLGGLATDRRECIVCRQCVGVCPEGAVRFGFARRQPAVDAGGPALSRRGFVGSLAGGLAVGLGMRADLLHPSDRFSPLPLRDNSLIRPPGALPEPEFLSRCARCGECLRACLTNTLQPDWYRAGLEGLWAPMMNLRHAHCELSCNTCGQVCPTGAIRPLSHQEKKHAKVGTAVVRQHLCVAWSENRHCLVCDEVCPCNAVFAFRDANHSVGLPVVRAERCLGCGTCQEKCVVEGEAAIVVVPRGEIRLSQGSYVREAAELGFDFTGTEKLPDQVFQPPPDKGTPDEGGGLPPGIAP